MAIVRINWSGGKDSTASVIKHLELRDKCKVICYVPMLNDYTPLIRKDHYLFICRTAARFGLMGADVQIVNGETFYEFVHKIRTRGKFKGMPNGAGICSGCKPGICGFKRDSKLKALNTYDFGDYDYKDIGIAADETKRQGQLTDDKKSILCALGIDESHAFKICEKYNMLSPIYSRQSRDGCVICPYAKDGELMDWFIDYPGSYKALMDIEKFCKENRPDRPPLPGKLWWSDTI